MSKGKKTKKKGKGRKGKKGKRKNRTESQITETIKGFFKEEERRGCSYTLKRFMDKMKTYSDKKNYSCFSRIKKSETTEMLKRIGEERRNLFLKIFNETPDFGAEI